MPKPKTVKLSLRNQVAMYRNAFFTAMRVQNGEKLPSDRQCLQLLNGVINHATMYQTGPLLPSIAALPFDWRQLPE